MNPPQLAEIGGAFPGWRGWRTPAGDLAARKGGSAPGVQARGRTVAELKLAIAFAILAAAGSEAPPKPVLPVLRPHERAVLTVLETADGPLPARIISDRSGVPSATTTNALGVLRARHLVTSHRDGRTWLYTAASGQHADKPQDEAAGDVPICQSGIGRRCRGRRWSPVEEVSPQDRLQWKAPCDRLSCHA